MKINKFFAIAAIVVMAAGTMGFIKVRTHGQGGTSLSPQVQVIEASDGEQKDGPDTDNVQEQVGDQNAPDTSKGSEVDVPESKAGDAAEASPAGTPGISSDAALKAAQAYLNTAASGTAVLEDENGKLVYGVQLNGRDMKVDAMTGLVLRTDQVGNGQFEGAN
jgi:uncharacterized membrane protein YkoI